MDVVTDTTLLVGLWRRQPWAVRLAERQGGASVGIPWVVLAEFWQGAAHAGHPPELVERFLALGVPIVDATPVIPVCA